MSIRKIDLKKIKKMKDGEKGVMCFQMKMQFSAQKKVVV